MFVKIFKVFNIIAFTSVMVFSTNVSAVAVDNDSMDIGIISPKGLCATWPLCHPQH